MLQPRVNAADPACQKPTAEARRGHARCSSGDVSHFVKGKLRAQALAQDPAQNLEQAAMITALKGLIVGTGENDSKENFAAAVAQVPQTTKSSSKPRLDFAAVPSSTRGMRTAYQAYLAKAIREANKEYNAGAEPVAAKKKKENVTCPVAEARTEEASVSGKVVECLDNLIIGKQVGQGAYATVRVAFDKTLNIKVALKIYDKSKLMEPQRQKGVQREIRIMEKLSHPHIAKLYSAFDTKRHVVISMEYVKGSSLHGYLKSKPNRRLDEAEARRVFRQVLSGVEYCHERSVAHRDIKLENLLMDEQREVKIIDFGFSTCIPNTKKIRIFCGTPSYMSPEIVTRKEYAGPPADVWALGVLLYAMLCGTFPFKGSTDKELYRRITRGQFVLPEHLSSLSKALLIRILNVDADRRPTAHDIAEDSWLQINADPPKQLTSRGLGAQSATKSRPVSGALAPCRGEQSDRVAKKHREALAEPATGKLDLTQVLTNAAPGSTVNNNFNIINNITHINCQAAEEGPALDSVGGRNNTSSLFSKSNGPSARSKNAVDINPGSVDCDLVTSIVRLGYPLEEVQKQLQDGSSHIHLLYTRLLKQKKNMNVGVAPQFGPSMNSFEGSQRLRSAKSRAEGYIRIDGVEAAGNKLVANRTNTSGYDEPSGDVLNNTAPFVFGASRPAITPTSAGRFRLMFK